MKNIMSEISLNYEIYFLGLMNITYFFISQYLHRNKFCIISSFNCAIITTTRS
jgi:hypothetical protein